MNYVLIPLMVQYQMQDGLTLRVGPQLGFMLTAKGKLDNENYDIKHQMNTMDIFLALGGAYRIHDKTEVGLRYQHGFIDANETLNLDRAGNRAILLFATYQIGL